MANVIAGNGGSVHRVNDNGTNFAGMLHDINGIPTVVAVIYSTLGYVVTILVKNFVFSFTSITFRNRDPVFVGRLVGYKGCITNVFYVLKRSCPICFRFGNNGNIMATTTLVLARS